MPRSGEGSRERLLRAAFALIQERGYDQTTAAEIAERAGVTERTFFRHFPDKKEVLFAGETAFRERLVGAVAAAPGELAPLQALLWGFHAVAEPMEALRPFLETRRKAIAGSPALQERELAKAAALIEGLADALRRRGLEADKATLAAHMGISAFLYATNAWTADSANGLDLHLDRAFAQMRALTAPGA